MARADLKRLLRGPAGQVITDTLGLLAAPCRVEDPDGNLLLGSPEAEGPRVPLATDDDCWGHVVGPAGAERVATLILHLLSQERDKRSLADETLGRYKELTLLYDMSERLSKLLDLEAVAVSVAEQARRALKASSASLLLHDPRRGTLEAAASVGELSQAAHRQPANEGLAGRVLETGRAELVEDTSGDARLSPGGLPPGVAPEVRAMVCAPLRAGERVFGVLRVTQDQPRPWTAGDLKLVTALAANAASAISNAQLHQERLLEVALRHRVERFVSPRLLEAVFDGPLPSSPTRLVVAFCDARGLSSASAGTSSEEMLGALEVGVVLAARAFMDHDGVIDTPQGELVIGVFRDGPTHLAPHAAHDASYRAVLAARDLMDALERRGLSGRAGVGIASAVVDPERPSRLNAAINAAAILQSEAEGRIVVDDPVAASLRGVVPLHLIGPRELPDGPIEIFEVRA